MANCNKQQLNITCGTDVVLHDRLIFDNETFDPALSTGIAANLVSSLGKRTPLEVEVADGELIIQVPWSDGHNAGFYGLEVTGTCNMKKWATYADSLIHYTRATEVGVSEVEMGSDYYDVTQVVGYRYGDGGNVNDVLVNSYSVVRAGKAIISVPTKVSDLPNDLEYQTAKQVEHAIEENLVPYANVTVDDNIGTPSATVTKTGRTLNFDFKNLKGKPFTYKDFTPQQLKDLTGPIGPQGVSVIVGQGDLPLANTLGISSEKAITQKAATDGIMYDISTIVFSSLTPVDVYVADGVWTESSSSQSYFIEVRPGVDYRITPPSGGQSRVFFLSDKKHTEGEQPHYVGVSELPDWIREETLLTAPNGAAYMYVRRKNSTTNFTPSIDVRVPSNVKLSDVSQELDELAQDYNEKNILSLDEINILTDPTVIDNPTQSLFFINELNVWKQAASYTESSRSVYFPVIPGKTLKVVSQEGGWFRLEFLTDWSPSIDERPSFATEDPIGTISGGTHYFVVPQLAKYVYLRRLSASVNRLPAYIGYVEYTYPNIIENNKNLKKVSDSVGLLYGQTIKPAYRRGAWNSSGYVGNRPGAAVSEEIVVESNVEKLEFVNPCPDKVIYIVYRTTGNTPPYAPMSDYINRNFPVTHEDGVRYVIRMKPAGVESKAELDKLSAEDYPYARLKLKDSTLVETDNARLEKLIANAKHFAYTYLGNTDTENDTITDSLALLHYTDLHGDTKAAGKIRMWSRIFGKYINDVLNTGDVVLRCADDNNDYPQGREWWQKSGLPEISLNLLGNHDGADNSLDWYAKTKEFDFQQYIEPYIDSMGVTMPEGYDTPASQNYQACYWHKDYAAQKIRLIGMDCLHRFDGIVDPETGQRVTGSMGIKWDSTEQEEWLVARLNDTLDSNNAAYGYSVVIACHYQLDDYHGANMKAWANRSHDYTDFNHNATGGYLTNYKTNEGTNWHLFQRYPEWEINPQYGFRNRTDATHRGDVNNVGNIIKHFMDSGGKFVVWLSGHVHCDMLYYPNMFPDILVCANTCAGVPSGGTREDRTVERAAANYVVIDTAKGLLKIVRLGVNTSPYLAPINTLCYDYRNRKIMFEQ